jgi:4-nitrophenyl phosphatase
MSLTPDAVVCCDLDGVVWRGDTPIAGSAEGIAALRAAGRRVGFITNNSSIPIAGYVERLAAFGVPTVPDDVCTSAQAAAALVASKLEPGAAVLACAGPGVIEALTERGLRAVDAGPVDAVVVGFHRDFDFDRLRIAADAVRGSALFVATNLDPTYPIAGGLVPGTGALVAAVATAGGRAPLVAGKPEQPMADLVRSRFGSDGIMIGDRPSTDGAFAAALGWPFALVLSGVAGDGEEPVPDPPPPFVADDLARLVPSILSTAADGT